VDVSYLFAGLAVANRDAAAAWYERLLGRPADMLPNDDEAAWQLTGSGSVYLVADPERAGSGVVTLIVTDLDACLAGLAARGIPTGPVAAVGTAGRKCVLTDPDGNQVSIVELAG